MGCIGIFFALATPRLVMILLWIFSDYLSRAYEGIIVPLVGFFVLPTTTFAYAVAENETGGFRDWGALVVILALVLDLGLWGRGRGVFSRH